LQAIYHLTSGQSSSAQPETTKENILLTDNHILRIAPLRRLWIGQAISDLGDHIYFIVFLFMAGKLSGGSTQVIGGIGAIQALPWLLLGPLAGTLADRLDRRKIMLVCALLSGIITAAFGTYLAFDPTPPIWLIGLTGGSLSVVNVFFFPARTAAIPRLVPTERLLEANGLIMSTQTMIGMGGAAFSATILGVIAKVMPDQFFMAATLLNSITFFAASMFIFGLPAILPDRSTDKDEVAAATRRGRAKQSLNRTWVDIKEGLRAIFQNPVMRWALPISVGINLFVSGFFPLYIKTNDVWFGGEFSKMAWIEFSFMVPLAAMSLLMSRFKITRPGLAYSLALMAAGATIAFMGWGQNYFIYVLWNFLCGFTLPFAWIPITTYMQAGFPDELRGRVSSVWTTMSQGIQPISLITVGALLAIMPLTPFYVVIGGAMVVFAGLGLFSRSYRTALMPAFAARVEPEELDDLEQVPA
jgi:MFS family permease